MKIEHISYPYVFTDDGKRLHAKQLNGTPKVGFQIDEDFNVVNNGAVDENCLNGACDYQPPQPK